MCSGLKVFGISKQQLRLRFQRLLNLRLALRFDVFLVARAYVHVMVLILSRYTVERLKSKLLCSYPFA